MKSPRRDSMYQRNFALGFLGERDMGTDGHGNSSETMFTFTRIGTRIVQNQGKQNRRGAQGSESRGRQTIRFPRTIH